MEVIDYVELNDPILNSDLDLFDTGDSRNTPVFEEENEDHPDGEEDECEDCF